MLFVYVAAARLSVTSGASQPFHRNWDDSETTQQKHYVDATSCHAISVHVIDLPTHLYCIYNLLAGWQSGDAFLTIRFGMVIDSHAIKFCIHHPSAETIQVSARETAAVWVCRWLESEQQFQHLCHDACPNRPIPSWTSGISARGRCRHLLEETAGSLFTPCPTCIRPSGTGLLCVQMADSWPQKQTI